MKFLFIIAIGSLTLMACEQQERFNNPPKEMDVDNTGINVRDRDSMTETPLDQSENKDDRTVTQKIRQAIMADTSLSTNAKNIKIITINGVVTLRGPVTNTQEKDAIARKVQNVQGVMKVDNQLDVKSNNY